MKIATWNINSLRVRLPSVLAWIEKQKPDVLALQELKMEDKDFPREAFESIGYNAVWNGQKTYNGVAIISRLPMSEIQKPDFDEQHRLIAATVNHIRFLNIYVPNGESISSTKYEYKLNWLKKLEAYLRELLKNNNKIIVLGDFNIAPSDEDVYDPKRWQEQVLCSTPERNAWNALLKLGFSDAFRLFPQTPESYSWWDYRTFAFKRNAGLRIDHVLVTQALLKACKQCEIDKLPRSEERPSDHTPVVLELESC